MSVPKPTAFDAQTFQDALDQNIQRPDGKPYAVFKQFRDWKLWNDKQRDFVETNRVGLVDQKKHVDKIQGEVNTLKSKVAALEAQQAPVPFFPGSG